MDVPLGGRSEGDPTHRQVLTPGTPLAARVTPRSRTAIKAARAGDRRSAPCRWPTAVGLPARRQAHRAPTPAPVRGRP